MSKFLLLNAIQEHEGEDHQSCFHCSSHSLLMVKVGNVGGREFSESLAPDVQKLLVRV